MNNYDSYIQEIDINQKFGASMVYKLKSFDDVLEISDRIQKPILMLQNKKNTGTFFIIPANEYTIYSYALRVVDVVAAKKGLKSPDYNVKSLNKESAAEVRFTKEHIESQIDDATRTIKLGKLDNENIIMGNKDRDEDIYTQLEMTTNYKLSDFKEDEKNKKECKKKKSKKKREKVSIKKINSDDKK